MKNDLYEVLGISRDATPAQVKKAYRKLAMKHHPDKNPNNREEAEVLFKEVAEAFEILSDPEKRQVYDTVGSRGFESDSDPSGGHSTNIDPHELFSQFFQGFGRGGVFGGNFEGGDPFGNFVRANGFPRSGSHSPPHFQKSARPRIVSVKLQCTLEELYHGAKKRMKVQRSSFSPNLQRSPSIILEIDIRPGWKADTRITFRGVGDEISPGEFQDVVFVIVEKSHNRFRRQGANLIYYQSLNLVEALTGFDLNIKLLDNTVLREKITHVIEPNSTKVVEGKGMPRSRAPGYMGDLIVVFNVKFPENLNEQQKQDLRATL